MQIIEMTRVNVYMFVVICDMVMKVFNGDIGEWSALGLVGTGTTATAFGLPQIMGHAKALVLRRVAIARTTPKIADPLKKQGFSLIDYA